MNLFGVELEVPDSPPVCIGNVYRYRERNYKTKNGYCNGFELILLKKLSCAGCDQCGCRHTVDDDLADDGFKIVVADGVKDFDTVTLDWHIESRDESGYPEEWYIVARKATQ